MPPPPPQKRVALRAGAWIDLIRPGNVVVAAAGVFLGAVFAGGRPTKETVVGAVVMGLLVAAGNSHNDLTDLETDRLNRPERPLPSGALSARAVCVWSAAASAAALALSGWVGISHLLWTAGLVALLFLYNTRLKGMPRGGNFAVAFLSATPMVWHGWPDPSRGQWAAVAVALLWSGVRELIKDFEDVPGDRTTGRQTLPIAAGERRAVGALGRRIAAALIVSAAVPWIAGWGAVQSVRYEAALLLLVLLPVVASLRDVRRALALPYPESLPFWRQGQRRIKEVMIGGMIALVVGAL